MESKHSKAHRWRQLGIGWYLQCIVNFKQILLKLEKDFFHLSLINVLLKLFILWSIKLPFGDF